MSIKNQQNINAQKGFLLVDAIVGLAIAGIVTYAFVASVHTAIVGSDVAHDRFQANMAVLEVYEIAIALGQTESGFATLQSASCMSTPCYFVRTGTTWSIVSGSEIVSSGDLTRSFTLSPVARQSSSDSAITTTGGIVDPDTLALTITVAWERRGDLYSEEVSTYIHNLQLRP